MKIHGGNGSGRVDLYIKKKVDKRGKDSHAESASTPKSIDSVEISQTGTEVKKAKEVISEQPEIRQQKVNAVKKEVDEGTYKVDGEKVAEKIIRQNILDELL